MQNFFIKLIKYYKNIVSSNEGVFHSMGLKKTNRCVFYPSCSDYTIQAIEKYGIFKGFFLGIKRIFKCHPYQKEHFDPLP